MLNTEPAPPSPGARSPKRARSRRFGIGALALVILIALAGYLSTFNDTYTDDAFIQLAYARNVARHGTWGLIPDRLANTATSPLNVLLTAAFTPVFDSALAASVWVTAIELIVLFALLLLISQRLFHGWFFGVFASMAYLSNPLLMSTLGLESTLFATATIASMYFLIARRWRALAAALAVLTLARPDGLLLFLICVLFVPGSARTRIACALIYAALLAPWHLYSWLVLGSFVPDTLVIKIGQGAWREGMTFVSGLRVYLGVYPLATAASFLLLPLAVLAIGRMPSAARPVAGVLAAYAVLHFLCYAVLRVPPYHWYYVHQMIPAVFLGSLGAAASADRLASSVSRSMRSLRWLIAGLPVTGMLGVIWTQGFPLTEAPIHTNWALHRQYKEAGLWLNSHLDPATVVTVDGEVGTLAFYSERQLVNEFSEQAIVSEWIHHKERSTHPMVAAVLRLNGWWRRDEPIRPPSYALRYVAADRLDRLAASSDVVKTWPLSSRWATKSMRPMRLVLIKTQTMKSPKVL